MQAHNPKIATNGLIYHLDPTNGGKGGSKIITKPTQVDDCIMWMDADDDESIVLSSGTVENWLDKSGSGYHWTPSSAGLGPTRTVKVNSRDVLSFATSDDLRNTSINRSGYDFTGFVVSRYTPGAHARILQSIIGNWLLGHWSNSVAKFYAVGWVSGSSSSTYNFETWQISSATADYSGDVYELRSNGKDFTNASSGGSSGGPNGLSVNSGYTGEDSTCEVAEIIFFSRTLSPAEVQSIEYYLSRKWAIPLKGRPTTNLADGVNTTISNSSPVEVTHLNTLYFPNSVDDNCDLRLEGNEITIADNLPWTMEFWVKRHARGPMGTSTTFDGVWGNTYTSTEYDRLTFSDADEDKLMFVDSVNAGTHAIITNSADIDCLHKWRHVVIAFDGTTDATTAGCVRQYVDGSDKGSTLAFPHADTKIRIRRIASRGSTSDAHRLEGELGNFRVYNKQLSHAEVLQNYNAQRAKYQNKKMNFAAPDNLKLYLDAQSGTSSNYYADGTWYDISGGTANNATRANATFTDEEVKYYDFDGTGDYFTIGTTTDLQFGSNDFSVSFWFKGGGVDNGYVIRRGSWATDGWYIYYQGSSQRELQFYTNDSTDVTDTARNTDSNALTTGVWYYAVVVKSGTTANWYLNGVESTLSHDGNGMIPPKDNASRVAYISDAGGGELNGALANLMIHDVALSADQVMQNYNYFKHRFGK